MDISKAAAVMHNNEGPINQYAGVNLVPNPGLPTILIPTTAGTGSEVTSIAVLSDTANQVKVGVVSDHMFARLVLLDPELTLGLPSNITASTGLDALIHAIESYTGRQATFLTEPLAMEAIRLIGKNLRLAYVDGANVEARTGMLQASLLAGMAFANTQTAGAHACALSLGGKFHLPHGIATSLMLPAIMRFNSIAAPAKFANIAEAFGECLEGLSPMEKAEKAIVAIVRLIEDVGFELGLENYGVKQEDIPALAKGAIGAARLWNNNPRNATEKQIQQIFKDSFLQ
jgi:alcohol dehydrogenase class IV